MNICLIALDGVFDTGLSLILDAFSTANELAALQGLDLPGFKVSLAGVRKTVRSAQGLKVPVSNLPEPGNTDWVILPAIGYKMPGPLLEALKRKDVGEAKAALQEYAGAGRQVGAACIGTFVLAESGLLDGRSATTSWWMSAFFRQRYPRVTLDESRMLVRSGNMLTAGAALSHIELALWLIRQESPLLADTTAKYLIVDSRPAQSAYIISDHLQHSDPLVRDFEKWTRANLAQGFSLDQAASDLATSKRTLARRLQEILGKSPLAYFQDLRVERAVHLLKISDDNVESIAAQVGYADGTTLRTLLRRRLGYGVRQIRGTF